MLHKNQKQPKFLLLCLVLLEVKVGCTLQPKKFLMKSSVISLKYNLLHLTKLVLELTLVDVFVMNQLLN